jgi:thiol-disulfide isomerase/thioredoxin
VVNGFCTKPDKFCKKMAYKFAFLPLLLAFRLSAQLPDGSIAPDFEATDIKGQTWRLYDLLAQDKVVLLEISATWCPPCWSYHKSNAMQNCYAAWGPNGTDQLRALFVEGDDDTNVDCLYGLPSCNLDSPIIDNSHIAELYKIKYYPTVFAICPNKKVYEVGAVPSNELWQQALTCPVAKGSHNVGIFDYSPGTELREVCDTLPLAPHFNLINLGSTPLTSASIELKWTAQTV